MSENNNKQGSRLPPPAFPPGSRKQHTHRNSSAPKAEAAPKLPGGDSAYISPDDPMPARTDKVAKDKVRLNQGDSFAAPVTVSNLVAGDGGDAHIELNTSRSTGTGWEAPYSVYSRNTSFSTTRARRILIDADGDGLIDALKAGKILRNATDLDSGEPAFVPGFDPTAPGALAAVDEETRAALEARIFNVDPVIRWVAPFHGKIRIAGPLRWDGREAVFHRDFERPIPPVEAPSLRIGARPFTTAEARAGS